MATQNPYSDSLLADAFRGSLSNLESLGRGFAVAPVGLLGDVNALAREYITPRLPSSVQGLLQQMPAAPTTERILSNIPRVSAPRMETAGMEQLGAAMNPRGPVDLARGAGRLAGSAVNEAMVYGRGPLAAITPQPMRMVDEAGGLLSYRGSHKAPSPEFGAPLYDLTGGGQMYPADVYSAKAAQYYGTGFPKADKEAFALANKVRGNPDAEVTMYRAVPKDEKITNINAGDWVTLSKDYAKTHGESVLGNNYKILSQKVKAKDLWTNADSIHEFGYQPQAIEKPSFTYPQEEAMRLAQQRAALPVEQGGLGLAANNTAAEREAAMFPLKAYRGVTGDVESSVMPSDFFGSNYFGKGINITTSPQDASKYASTDVGVNHDLVSKAELMSQKLGISYPEAKAELTRGGGAVMPISANIDNPLVVGMQKIQAPDSMIRYALNEAGYSGNVDKLVNQFKNANTGIEQFKLMQENKATPFYRSMSSLMNKNGLMIDPSLSPKSEGGMHYLATDPEQIRSRFAAFDPFRRTAATAAAMGVAAPDLLAQEQPQSAGLLYPLP